jgi:hypothetical protein
MLGSVLVDDVATLCRHCVTLARFIRMLANQMFAQTWMPQERSRGAEAPPAWATWSAVRQSCAFPMRLN